MTQRSVLLALSIVGAGLMAGFFYAWFVSVIKGTRLIDDLSYVSTMHMRQSFETRWNQWHNLRTVGAGLSFALATAAAVISEGDA